MKLSHKIGLALLIFALCTGFDRITKKIAQDELASSPPISLLNDVVRFQYLENEGAMLSLGANLSAEFRFVFFVVLVGVVLALAFAYVIKVPFLSVGQLVGLLILLSGGVGNYIDRVFNNGAVIDFVSIGVGPVRTGIFNLADVFIIAGAVVFAWVSFGQEDLAEEKTDE